MKSDLIDVLSEDGKTVLYPEAGRRVHELGLPHRTVHVWFFNPVTKQILVQKRSEKRTVDRGLWDIPVGEHIFAGEKSRDAARRGALEELGLEVPDSALVFLFELKQPRTVHKPGFVDDEWNDVYVVISEVDVGTLVLEAKEAAEVCWLSFGEFERWVWGRGEKLVPYHREEYICLLGYLRIHYV